MKLSSHQLRMLVEQQLREAGMNVRSIPEIVSDALKDPQLTAAIQDLTSVVGTESVDDAAQNLVEMIAMALESAMDFDNEVMMTLDQVVHVDVYNDVIDQVELWASDASFNADDVSLFVEEWLERLAESIQSGEIS